MKKLIYVLIIGFASSLALTSCTEEEVTPRQENGGGGVVDPR